MEVFHGDDILREEILNDAKNKADRLLKKARRDAEEIMINAEKELDLAREEARQALVLAQEESKKLVFASADIEVTKARAAFCGEQVDRVYGLLKQDILEDTSITYEALLFVLLEKAAAALGAGSYILEVHPALLDRLSLEKLRSHRFKNGAISQVVENDTVACLGLFSGDRKRVSYISLESFFEELKLKTRTAVYRIMIEGK